MARLLRGRRILSTVELASFAGPRRCVSWGDRLRVRRGRVTSHYLQAHNIVIVSDVRRGIIVSARWRCSWNEWWCFERGRTKWASKCTVQLQCVLWLAVKHYSRDARRWSCGGCWQEAWLFFANSLYSAIINDMWILATSIVLFAFSNFLIMQVIRGFASMTATSSSSHQNLRFVVTLHFK